MTQENKPKTFEEEMMLARATYFMTHPSNSEANLFQDAYESGYSSAVEATRKEMQPEIDDLKMRLDTCENDYWFMTNLLESYSTTDLQRGVNDCIERMKFRRDLFKPLNHRGEDEI